MRLFPFFHIVTEVEVEKTNANKSVAQCEQSKNCANGFPAQKKLKQMLPFVGNKNDLEKYQRIIKSTFLHPYVQLLADQQRCCPYLNLNPQKSREDTFSDEIIEGKR